MKFWQRCVARRSPRGRGLGIADQLTVQQVLALLLADRDDLVALAQDRVRAQRGCDAVADDREQRAAIGDVELSRGPADRGRTGLEMRLDELELALAECRPVEELVDRDVLVDRAEDPPGRRG